MVVEAEGNKLDWLQEQQEGMLIGTILESL